MSASGIDRAIDALMGGEMDFTQFRRVLEQQIGRNPARRVPTRERLDTLKEAGRMSDSLYRILVDELDRSAFGEITVLAPGIAGEDEDPALSPEPAPGSDAAGVIEATEPEERIPPPATKTPDKASPRQRMPGEGEVLAGRYLLESILGRGGTSVVFRARDLRMPDFHDGSQFVAVKVLTPEFAARADARAALGREAGYARRLNHQGLVRVFDADVDGSPPFVVMELLEGERLRNLLVRRYPNPLPESEALLIIRALAEVLAYLHGTGVVHRDVKPANVFITPRGEIRLLDLGVSGPTAERPGEASTLRARTPVYASPGVLAGASLSPADDVYALGCVAYEVLAGRHPFGKLPGNEAAAQGLVPPRVEALPAWRWQALRRSLEFEAARRQSTAAEFVAEFFAQPPSPNPVRPWAAGGVLAGLVAGLVLGWFAPPPQALLSRSASLTAQESSPGSAPAAGKEAAAAPVEVPDQPAPAATGQEMGVVPPAKAEPIIAAALVEESGPIVSQAGISPGPEVPATQTGRGGTETLPSEPAPAAEGAGGRDAGQRSSEESGEAPGPVAQPVRAPASLALPASVSPIREGESALRVRLNRPAGYRGPLRVEWRTVSGTARDGDDYAGADWQELEAPAGSDALVLYVPIVSDARAEPAESFFLEIRRARGGPAVGAPDRLQVVIQDDDTAGPAG